MSNFDYSLPGNSGKDKKRRKKRTRISSGLEDDLAAKLKSTYVSQRRMYEAAISGVESKYCPAKRFDGLNQSEISLEDPSSLTRSLWKDVATRLHKKGIDPAEYVRRIFACVSGNNTPFPQPNQLMSSRCLEIYRGSAEQLKEDVALAFEIQRKIAAQAVVVHMKLYGRTLPDALNRVIRDSSLSLSDLFRYCLATTNNSAEVQRLIPRFKERAAVQYFLRKVAYDEVWGKYIPKSFKDEAGMFYEEISQQMD